MPNPDGSPTDREFVARMLSDAIYQMKHGGTREKVATQETQVRPMPPPTTIEELLQTIVDRLDTLIKLTQPVRRN
jgi:hypothetical protein